MRAAFHIILHGLVPLAVAGGLFRPRWRRAFALMMSGMLIDLDHFLAVPVYAPNRCSLGFHPLHTAPAAGLYVMLALWPRTRLVGLGLVIHIVLDGIDCYWMRLSGG